MENLKIPEQISEFVETKQLSAVRGGQEFLITMSKRLKKREDQEIFQAITFGYCVEGSDENEVLEAMLKYISEREVETPNVSC